MHVCLEIRCCDMYRFLSQRGHNLVISLRGEAFLAYVRYVAAAIVIVLGVFLVFPLLVPEEKVFRMLSDGLISIGLPVRNVVVQGNVMVSQGAIRDVVDQDRSIVLLSLKGLGQRIKQHSPWIKDVRISRVLASGTLKISIKEHDAFANWYHHGINSVVDRGGYVIINSEGRLAHLVSVYGDDAVEYFEFVREVLDGDGALSSMISSFSLLDTGGWNVDFSSGLRVKLPRAGAKEAWARLTQLYLESDGLLMWREIDMRNVDKISVKK